MPSSLAWLDTSAEQQRQIRELIRLYSQPESRDELGYGQIRDVLSEALFPGTSVLQNRARYFLFVPWSYREAARTKAGEALKHAADKEQRQLITTLKQQPDLARNAGLIGARAGSAVKILPSTIYWNALVRYGILTTDIAPDQLTKLATNVAEDELAERAAGDWHATLPPRPEGFPHTVPDGFDLTAEEAAWLRERMLSATEGTLLGHLLNAAGAPAANTNFPWEDPACHAAEGDPQAWLTHARCFSTVINGAALLYNRMLGEVYADKGYGDGRDFAQELDEAIEQWRGDVEHERSALQSWDRADFWLRVLQRNPRISPPTREFVRRWVDTVVDGTDRDWAHDAEMRTLVRSQEERVKRKQSRFANDRLLRSWGGEAGTGRLTYRWRNVRNIVTDIHDGLRRADA